MHIVEALEAQTHHERDYIAKRKDKNIWILLCFTNDCIIETKSGMQEAHSGDCFIKSPGFTEYHYTPENAKEGFINDWIHVNSDTIQNSINLLNLPTNEIIKTHQPELIRSSIHKIINEKRKLLPYNDIYISNLVEFILIKMARASVQSSTSNSKRYEEVLLDLRLNLQNNLNKQWSIEDMADFVGLSSSRFSVLYKKRFGLSPNDDLIRMRIDKSKILLLSTNLKLLQISQICGFKNEYYFSRVFKKSEDISPGSFRRLE